MKILLLLPPSEGEVTEFNAANYIISDFAHYPPLGLLAIATGIDPKHTVKVLDSVTKKMSIFLAIYLVPRSFLGYRCCQVIT